MLFPKAKLITTTGQVMLGAEPVRAKRAHVWMSGDSDVLLFAKRNALGGGGRAREADRQAARTHGRCATATTSGSTSSTSGQPSSAPTARWTRLFKHHMEKLGAA